MDRRMVLGHLSAQITVLLWGMTFVTTKVLLGNFKPVEILFFRFCIGYAALWLIAPRALRLTDAKQEICFAIGGFCGVTLYFLLENIALAHTLVSNVGVIISVAPFFTAILAYRFLEEEKFNARFVIGFAAAIAGIVLIVFNGNFMFKTNPFGDFLALSAALAWAVYSIVMKKIAALGYGMIQCTRRIFFYGLLFMIPCLSPFGFRLELERFASPANLLNILFLGLGASALCFVTWNWAVKVLGALKTSVYIYGTPVVNILASVVVIGERITPVAVVGTVLTLIGLVISESGQRGKVERSDEASRS